MWKTVWNKVWKYKTLKELDKNRPNKEVDVQFNVPCRTLATGQKNKEKIQQAFQNSSLKRQKSKQNIWKDQWCLVEKIKCSNPQ